MSLLLLGVASIFTALGDEVSVRLKQGMVSCNDLEILGRDPATELDDFLEKFQTASQTFKLLKREPMIPKISSPFK